jgi:hypothetical protein
MLNRLKNLFGRGSSSTTVTNSSTVINSTSTTKAKASTKSKSNALPLYEVAMPGHKTVRVRQPNMTEARKFVRDANGMKRLPSGTTVERIDG